MTTRDEKPRRDRKPHHEAQLGFNWPTNEPAAEQDKLKQPTSQRPHDSTGKDDLVATSGYGPGHTWHYLPDGDNAPPVSVDAIPAAQNLAHTFDRELPKSGVKRLVKARALLDAERLGLEEDRVRYQQIVDRGADALSRYDREIAHGGNLETARASALALKYNHIAWRLGRIAFLERELSHSVGRWR